MGRPVLVAQELEQNPRQVVDRMLAVLGLTATWSTEFVYAKLGSTEKYQGIITLSDGRVFRESQPAKTVKDATKSAANALLQLPEFACVALPALRGKKRPKVDWAANKSFEVLKLKFKFSRARTFELFRARSRLYRSRILQVNTPLN